MEAATLEQMVERDPFDEASTLSLIALLSASSSNNNSSSSSSSSNSEAWSKCEAHRSAYADRFLPDASFWLAWITDTKSRPEAAVVETLDALFARALACCPHTEILLAYVEDMQDRLEAELISEQDMRMAYEKAVSLGGADMLTGARLWQMYCNFEVEEHRDEVEMAETEEELAASKQRMIRVYHRQLALPLHGNETSLQAFEKVLEELCVESDVKLIDPEGLERRVAAANKERAARSKVESQLVDADFLVASLEERVKKWRWYIKFESKAEQPSRMQRLYERAVIDCRQSEELWREFAAFAAHTVRNWPLLESVTTRAIKPCYNSITLWRYHLLALETTARSDLEVAAAVQRSLLCGFAQPEHYLAMLQLDCDYRLRRLRTLLSAKHAAADKDRAVARLREAHDQAETFLSHYYPTWLAGWLQLYKRRVAAEDDIFILVKLFDTAADNSASVAVWERAVEALAQQYHGVWQEYIAWAQQCGDEALCRTLYRRAVSGKDHPNIEALCLAWVDFEQQSGSLDNVLAAMGKTGPILAHWAWKKTQGADEHQHQHQHQQQPAAGGTAHRSVRASEGSHRSHNGDKQSRKRAYDESNVASTAAAAAPAPTAAEEEAPVAPAPAKRLKLESEDPRAALDAVTRTAHVKNIIFRATTEQITTHFATQCGDVQELHVVLSKAGKFRGIAFVTFLTHEAYDKALALHGSKFYNFELGVGPCDKDDDDASVSIDSLDYVRQNYKRVFSFDRAQRRDAPRGGGGGGGAGATADAAVPAASAASSATATTDATASTPESSLTVFVSKFPLEYTSVDLRALFEPCGAVVEARVFADKKTGASKRVGVVQFATEDGKLAAFGLNKTTVGGHKISVAPSKFEWSENVAKPPPAAATAAGAPPNKPGLGFRPRTLKLKT